MIPVGGSCSSTLQIKQNNQFITLSTNPILPSEMKNGMSGKIGDNQGSIGSTKLKVFCNIGRL